jgi:hypothetical protein
VVVEERRWEVVVVVVVKRKWISTMLKKEELVRGGGGGIIVALLNYSTDSYIASMSTYLSPPFLSYLAHRPWRPSPLIAPTTHLVFEPCPET